MTYLEFRDRVRTGLGHHPGGLTWKELKAGQQLPYERPCPAWTVRLEREIGLRRQKRRGRALVWELGKPAEVAKSR